MAMKNYRVDQEDGTSTFFQFDDSDDIGKQQLEILRDAAKDDGSPVKAITQADPEPVNPKGSAAKS